MEMNMNEALFMNGGEGDVSYAQNSRLAQKTASLSKPVLENTVQSLFLKDFHLHKVINVADLGCSGGPTPISVISTVKMGVEKKCKEINCSVPELLFYLNDLPGNDFNSLFKRVSTIYTQNEGSLCFVMGAPGSFYGRLFPGESLHLVHASYSLHFLSQAPLGLASKDGMPLNKGKIYVSRTSPPVVREAYLAQFKRDFTLFLECRAKEMVKDGHLMLTLQGRPSSVPTSEESCYQWELLADAIATMVSEGLVDEEKLDSFDVPYYTPTVEELQEVVESEGSFAIELLKSFTVDASDESENDIQAKGQKVCYNIRCISESMISYHFGEEVVEQVYDKLTQLVVEALAKESTKLTSIIAVLRRNIQVR